MGNKTEMSSEISRLYSITNADRGVAKSSMDISPLSKGKIIVLGSALLGV